MKEIVDIINQVINPATNKTIGEENRLVDTEFKGSDLHVKYKRDGIEPNDKKVRTKYCKSS